MENQLVKDLCSKQGFEQAASKIINNADIEAFSALVEKSDYLFDFVKQNVIKRLQASINESNIQNLIKFLSVYSYDYQDLIVSSLKKYADNSTKQKLKEIFFDGTDEEKAYCVKFFEDDKEFIEHIRLLSNSDFEPLSYNCATVLGKHGDEESFNDKINKLKSDDEFEVLSAVKFLTAYNNKKAIPNLFESMKTSTMAENIACELIYLEDIFELLKNYPQDSLLLINNIISGLGDVVPLSEIFNIQLYELIEHINSPVTLLHIKQKIEQLTENDEYLFDEDKTVKEEIRAIQELLNSKSQEYWDNLCDMININDNLVFFALNLISDLKLDYSEEIKDLIKTTNNQTVILKSVEVMKSLNKLSEISATEILSKISDENIKIIIESNFR